MTAQAERSYAGALYGYRHRQIRAYFAEQVEQGGVRCARCGGYIRPSDQWDLGHVDGDRSRYAGPEHRSCNRSTAGRGLWQPVEVEATPERAGVPADDERFDVAWLQPLRRIPRDAVWPRLMTVPHPRAVDSRGAEFVSWAQRRTGQRLRWWQRLVATRLLEIDDQGALVWEALILSMARQLGKSWLLRELILWRIHQGESFGEPQDVMHTGKDVAICKEVQRPARIWAKGQPTDYKVREVNGQEEIEYLRDGSRWMLRAKEAVYGYSGSLGAVDEAWKVRASSVDEGLTPTMVERTQPQLLLVSTAHRLATTLMLERRIGALAELESGAGDLLIEWSAPADAALDDVRVWRLASPHWTPQRERLIGKKLESLQLGELEDPDEPDPEQSFRAQWLNQWPRNLTTPKGSFEPLLPAGLWAELAETEVVSDDPLFVAVEDDYGRGAAVAACARLADGRIEVDGWLCPDWNSAIADVQRLGEHHRIRQLRVGASLLDRIPPGNSPVAQPGGMAETRIGLAIFRDLAAGRQLVHDEQTFALDDAITITQVRESASGLHLNGSSSTHLVKAAVWAVALAHKPTPMPQVF
jgi:hypothetical protein